MLRNNSVLSDYRNSGPNNVIASIANILAFNIAVNQNDKELPEGIKNAKADSLLRLKEFNEAIGYVPDKNGNYPDSINPDLIKEIMEDHGKSFYNSCKALIVEAKNVSKTGDRVRASELNKDKENRTLNVPEIPELRNPGLKGPGL